MDMQLQLAQNTDLIQAKSLTNILIQPKLDGVRAVWSPSQQRLLTKNGRPISSVPHIVNALKNHEMGRLPLDGELYLHGCEFDKINSAVRQYEKTDLMLRYHPFDVIMDDWDADRRINLLKLFDSEPATGIEPVITQHLKRGTQIESAFQACLDDGYEGIIIRPAKSLYMPGKNYTILKMEPKKTAEFELMELRDDSSIICKTKKGKMFICTGVQTSDISTLSSPSKIILIIIAYYNIKNGVPKFVRYKGFRLASAT